MSCLLYRPTQAVVPIMGQCENIIYTQTSSFAQIHSLNVNKQRSDFNHLAESGEAERLYYGFNFGQLTGTGFALKLEAACAKRKYSQGGLYYAELGVDVSHYRLNRGGARTHWRSWYSFAHRMGVIRRFSYFIPRQFRYWTSRSTRVKT